LLVSITVFVAAEVNPRTTFGTIRLTAWRYSETHGSVRDVRFVFEPDLWA